MIKTCMKALALNRKKSAQVIRHRDEAGLKENEKEQAEVPDNVECRVSQKQEEAITIREKWQMSSKSIEGRCARSKIKASYLDVNDNLDRSGLISGGRGGEANYTCSFHLLSSHKPLNLAAELIRLQLPLCKSSRYYFHEMIVLLVDILSPANKLQIMARTVNCK